MGHDIREIQDLEAFTALAPAWDALLAGSPCGSPFLTSAWLAALWRERAAGSVPRVICVHDGAQLVAGAALCIRPSRYYGVPLREWCFLGDRTSDRQGFLCRPDDRASLAAIWSHLRSHRRGCAIVRLEEIPAESPVVTAGREVWPGLEVEPSSPLPYLDLAGSWEQFELTLSRKFRSEIRTRAAVFAAWGDWRFEIREGARVLELWDDLVRVEVASHKSDRGTAFLAGAANAAFLRRFLSQPGGVQPVLLTLAVEGKLVGYLLALIHAGALHAYNTAYLGGYEKGSVGKWLLHQSIRYAYEHGLRRFDFLRGASQLKDRWHPSQRRNVRAVGFYGGPHAWVLRPAVFRWRPWLKQRRRPAVAPVEDD